MADADPVVRFAAPGEIPAVRRFLSENFPADAHQNAPGWLDWQLANPAGTRVAVAVVGDEIAGLSVFLGVRFRAEDGGETDGAFATSTMVAERFRRRGLGSALHRFRAEQYGYALSTGQSDANAKVYGRLGFAEIATFAEFLLCRRFPRPFAAKRWLRFLGSWLRWRLCALRSGGQSVQSLAIADLALPAAWFAGRGGDLRLCIQDSAYLEWRYGAHPYLSYEASLVSCDGRPLGVVIHRAVGNGVRRIVDVYCGEGDLATVLAGFCRGTAAARLEGVVAGSGLCACFAQAGFQVFPHGSRIVGETKRPELVATLGDGRWGFFAGDSDKDR